MVVGDWGWAKDREGVTTDLTRDIKFVDELVPVTGRPTRRQESREGGVVRPGAVPEDTVVGRRPVGPRPSCPAGDLPRPPFHPEVETGSTTRRNSGIRTLEVSKIVP